MAKRYTTRISWALLVTLTLAWRTTSPVVAQGPEEWSDLNIVFQDDSGIAATKPAIVVTDRTGAAHLLWLYKEDANNRDTWAISYAFWRDGIWSEPNDVLITPGGGAGEPRAVIGLDDQLHMIWSDQRTIWYSKSPIQTAADARSWTEPVPIVSGALEADLGFDDEGRLHLVFVTGEPKGPVLYLESVDSGGWSTPVEIYAGAPDNVTSMHPRVSTDDNARLHVTWTEYRLPSGWPPLGQLYARSEDGGENWNSVLQVAVGEQGQGTVLAVREDEVHLVWRGTSDAGNTYHQWSKDGGRTWREPVVVDPDGGFSGLQSLAVDSSGGIHLVRGDGGYQHWQDGIWEPVPALFADEGETGTLAIGPDDRIHWINTFPSSSETAIVMHRTALIDVPEISPTPLPNPTRTPQPSRTPSPVPQTDQTSTPTAPEVRSDLSSLTEDESSPAQLLIVGAVPATVLIGAVFVVGALRKRKG